MGQGSCNRYSINHFASVTLRREERLQWIVALDSYIDFTVPLLVCSPNPNQVDT